MSIEVMQETIAVQTERIGRGLEVLAELRSHLALPKFQGPGNDWISTGDLNAWVQRLSDALTAEDVVRLGSSVVSYDSDRRYSGVRGTVVGFRRHEGSLRYRIAVKSRFYGGAELQPQDNDQEVIPPVNGVERLFGGRCNEVELAG